MFGSSFGKPAFWMQTSASNLVDGIATYKITAIRSRSVEAASKPTASNTLGEITAFGSGSI